MKKANVAPVHKKVTNRFLKIPTRAFTPICETIFEQLIFNKLHEFFIEKELIFSSQSGFSQEIRISASYYLLLMTYINFLKMF